jgi:hypothetical protein
MRWLRVGAVLILFLVVVAVAVFAAPATKTTSSYIEVIPDTIAQSGQLNLSWGFITYDPAYPDCYIAIYTGDHSQLIRKIRITNPNGLNKTVSGLKITYNGFQKDQAYMINLYCEVMGGDKNRSCPGCGKNLDIIPVYITSKGTGPSDYVNCRGFPGTNCPVWQKVVSTGYSWNKTLGVPV